ncbi:MAG: hypothetical protein AMJ90_02020 [candidate division Zixibacteria bacterium SM23_73_2]|nr:MAG: hypothetical protein AMJ90_02020 [candidate division Zixibacteria bacterium SM23_73_2]
MRRGIISAVAAVVIFVLCFPTPTQSQKLAGRYGISFQTGLVIVSKLYQDGDYPEITAPHQPGSEPGFPLGVGLHYFINDKVIFGIEFAHTKKTSRSTSIFGGAWISTITWSTTEWCTHIKYCYSLSSNTSIYGKCGLKTVSLSRTFEHFHHPYHEMEMSSTIGGELGFGLQRLLSKNLIFFSELGFSHILTKGRGVRINDKEVFWKYPFNLQLYNLRIGLMILVGGKQEKPQKFDPIK